MTDYRDAPGHPGIEPRWTTSAKSGVGAAIEGDSRVAFTLSHGIINEVYFPRPDEACLRDLGLIVTDGRGYFSEEKRDAHSVVETVADGVPGYRVVSTARDGRYRIEKRIVADPRRDVVLQRVRFEALQGSATDYRVFVLAAPHLVNAGAHNTATVEDVKGWTVLAAAGHGLSLVVASSRPFLATSVGFVARSDGFTLLQRDFSLKESFTRAADGNVALCGELDMETGEADLAIGFGRDFNEAGFRARASLMDGFPAAEQRYIAGWQGWQAGLLDLGGRPEGASLDPYRVSTAVMRVHEAKGFAGGMIASLSIPWGSSKGDGDLGGYHLVWPRDLVESAGALLAMGAKDEARRILTYLQATQEADGHWAQNMWLDGVPYWSGIQMDETAFPILLVDQACRADALAEGDVLRFWPMVRHAARYILHNGPVTGQDRWEEDGGYSPFTLAVEIAALVVAADIAERLGFALDARYLRATADLWNASVERWTYAVDTDLSRKLGVPGYYVRISPGDGPDRDRPVSGNILIKNIAAEQMDHRAADVISPDALALVRFGLRAPDDPRILNTVRVIDSCLKVEVPQGSLWYRYNDDGYGEHADGAPFDGVGVGRLWPLMAGERAHYELAAGRVDEARRLLATLEGSANDSGLIPEQCWDGPDYPERDLFKGRPAGSAMPLVWAHGEHIKLLRSLRDGRVFDTPPAVVQRYQVDKVGSDLTVWRFNTRPSTIDAGRRLRIDTLAPARVHWSTDHWATAHDTDTRATSFHVHVAVIDTSHLKPGDTVVFTFFWPEAGTWENADFVVNVQEPVEHPW